LTDYHIAEPEVEEAIEWLFTVEDRFFDRDLPTYIVRPKGVGNEKRLFKEAFKQLVEELRPRGYVPKLRLITGRHYVSLLKREAGAPRKYTRNLILFAATVGTVFLDGYLRSDNPILTQVLMRGTPVFVNALLFTLSIMAIFGLHELGHKLISIVRGVDASMPYFIPAPPGMGGTFGAVITQREPPVNRDALFDLGMSGPLVGFLITILVTVIGLRLSIVVPEGTVTEWMIMFPEVRFQSIPFPLLLDFLASVIRPQTDGMVLMLHPVGFAAWVGCLVTFINLIPAWQLDGGHISRALFGRETHKIISVAGIILMLLSGYFIMAILIAFFMIQGGDTGGPLDDVSPLSASRKLLTLVYIAMVALTLVAIFPF